MARGQASKANQRQSKSHKNGYNKYRNEFKREKNKLRKVRRHLKKFPGDKVAKSTVDRISSAIRVYL